MISERLVGIERLRKPFFTPIEPTFSIQEERVADLLWGACNVTKITRPSKKQREKGIDFFVSIAVDGGEDKIPIVVKLSKRAAQKYQGDHLHDIDRKGIRVIVANPDISDAALADQLRSICQTFTITQTAQAEVAELVNAPV